MKIQILYNTIHLTCYPVTGHGLYDFSGKGNSTQNNYITIDKVESLNEIFIPKTVISLMLSHRNKYISPYKN